jgi:hypothetical protein
MFGGNELIVDLRIDDFGLSRELRSSLMDVFRMSSEGFENFLCVFLFQQLRRKIQTSLEAQLFRSH